MRINLTECKQIYMDLKTGNISPEEFEEWFKEHCEQCRWFKRTLFGNYCSFMKPNDNEQL